MKEGLRARDIEKWSQGGDGVLDATGEEVIRSISVLQNDAAVFHLTWVPAGLYIGGLPATGWLCSLALATVTSCLLWSSSLRIVRAGTGLDCVRPDVPRKKRPVCGSEPKPAPFRQ